jgi:hypothetical protein
VGSGYRVVPAGDRLIARQCTLSRWRCQGRRGVRLARGIRSSVCLALRAEVVKALAGFAVRLWALATISLAEFAAA